MKKVRKSLFGIFAVLFLFALGTSVAEAQEASSCNAEWNGNFCDASKHGNCLIICYPNLDVK